MAVSASMVKKLRDQTGAGFMDCKKALVENDGDFEKSVDWIRVKGLAAAAKKASRAASEGLVAVCVDGNNAAVVEINSETDFVSRNEIFQNLVKEVVQIAVGYNDIDSLKKASTSSGVTVEEELISKVASIRENMTLRRMSRTTITEGVIVPYIHNSVAPNMGRIAVLVALESKGDKKRLSEVAKGIAMHIAAAKPQAMTKDDVDPKLIEREKEIFTQQTKDSGKPQNIIDKMIAGRIRKYLEEIVLMDQVHVIEGKSKVSEIIQNLSKELGTDVKLKSYVRFEVGEGIEKEEKNFADEVASVLGS
ncbi:MAG TPA: translation elongation factor Ts [Candidatus Megaira endosymbiont of Nemacystus decipiens]|nr:translation elongation factor Ts [Candidatus Megaera endosymbiont of Nemacystus decipiens]